MKRALVTGAAGQDGYYLREQLAARGYEVYALYRGQDEQRLTTMRAEVPDVEWIRGDVTDAASMSGVVALTRPDLVFNMAGLSFVGLSWQMPQLYMQTNAVGFLNVLEACRQHAPGAAIVQASTSEMYGNVSVLGVSQGSREESPMVPVSPYGVSKLAAHRLCEVYRQSYGMHVSSAISFNHESPRRPPVFVTRKITSAAARHDIVQLGNMGAMRDWGFAGDYADAYIRMAEADRAADYVVGTGVAHSVRDLARLAYGYAGLDSDIYVRESLDELRLNDLGYLRADASRIKRELGWEPTMDFETLVRMMVDADSKILA